MSIVKTEPLGQRTFTMPDGRTKIIGGVRVTRLVRVDGPPRIERVPRVRMVDKPTRKVEVIDGKAVVTTEMRSVEEPLVETFPLEENGAPVLDRQGRPEMYKRPLFDEVEQPGEPTWTEETEDIWPEIPAGGQEV